MCRCAVGVAPTKTSATRERVDACMQEKEWNVAAIYALVPRSGAATKSRTHHAYL